MTEKDHKTLSGTREWNATEGLKERSDLSPYACGLCQACDAPERVIDGRWSGACLAILMLSGVLAP